MARAERAPGQFTRHVLKQGEHSRPRDGWSEMEKVVNSALLSQTPISRNVSHRAAQAECISRPLRADMLAGGMAATIALGSALPHSHQLHRGACSVHASAEALRPGNGASVNSSSVWTQPAIDARDPVRRRCSANDRPYSEQVKVEECSPHVDDVLNRGEEPA
jgi:hypothetical protein